MRLYPLKFPKVILLISESDFVIKSALREKISTSQDFHLILEQMKSNLLDLLTEKAYEKFVGDGKK